jgi:pilus assembly protein Flp/PilA
MDPGQDSRFQPILEGNKMTRFLLDETGLELSEYAVAAALVAIAVVTAFTTLGDAIGVRLNELVSRVNG